MSSSPDRPLITTPEYYSVYESEEEVTQEFNEFKIGSNDLIQELKNLLPEEQNSSETDLGLAQTQEKVYSDYESQELMALISDSLASHRFEDSVKLMITAFKRYRLQNNFVEKAILILFTQKSEHLENLTQIWKKLFNYNIDRNHLILEIIINYLKNNKLKEANHCIDCYKSCFEFFSQRSDPLINTILESYISYTQFYAFKQQLIEFNSSEEENEFLNEIKENLTKIIIKCENKHFLSQMDIFVLILIEIYENEKQFEVLNQLLVHYMNQNSDHLSSSLYLYDFYEKHPEFVENENRIIALNNILRLSPENSLVLELAEDMSCSDGQKLEIIMDFIDFTSNNEEIKGWKLLRNNLERIHREDNNNPIINKLWTQKYRHWIKSYFKLEDIESNSRKLIRYKRRILSIFESKEHQFVIKCNEKYPKKRKSQINQ
jgi:hypothetical protein